MLASSWRRGWEGEEAWCSVISLGRDNDATSMDGHGDS